MDTPLTFEADSAGAEAILFLRDAAGRALTLPSDRVHRMSFAAEAAPMPFAPPGCEGVARVDGVLATQLDLSGGGASSGAASAAPSAARYTLLLRGARGWCHARVSGVSLIDPQPNQPQDPALPRLDRLTEGLTVDRRRLTLDPEQPDDVGTPDGDALLVLRTGPRRIALPARAVERVAPHQGAWPLRQGDPDERVVVLGGDLLPGCSLAAWLVADARGTAPSLTTPPGADPEAGEGWAAVLRVEGRRAAVTFTALDGLVTAPPDRIRDLSHRGHTARHCLDPERGAIEILDPRGFMTRVENSHIPAPTDGAVDEGRTPRSGGGDDPPPIPDGGLAALAGPFVCVFSRGAADRLLTGTGLDRVAAERSPGALPVVDLAVLLGLPRPDAVRAGAGRLLRLNRPGRRPVALYVDGVAPTESAPDWEELPSVPPMVETLFSALRLVGPAGGAQWGGAQWLVRDRLLSDRPAGPFAARLSAAHLGWLDPRAADG